MSNAPKKSRTRKPVTLSQVIAKEASTKGVTPDKAGKAIRQYLRKHDAATLEKAGYTGLSKSKPVTNNKAPWPPMPAAFAAKVIKRAIK